LSVSLFRASSFAARRSDWFCFSVPVSLIVFVYRGGLAPSTVFVASHFFGNLFLRPVVLILYLLYGTGTVCGTTVISTRPIYILSRSGRRWLWSSQNGKNGKKIEM
jgi:hypothetical protein